MSQLIGTKDVFAIEYEFDETAVARNEHWLHGRMCFWIGGTQVGDFGGTATLAVALALFPDLLADSGKRNDEGLFRLPASAAVDRIFSALSIDSGQSNAQVSRDEAFYSRFRAVPAGFDIFDNWDVYLIEDQAGGRLLFRKVGGPVGEATLPVGEFDRVVQDFVNALQAETATRRARKG